MAEKAPTVAVLLGAGASADAGIPTTVMMTARIIERLRDPEHQRLLGYVNATLEADAAFRSSGTVDVERLFASVELLRDRYEQPWSPFVASWRRELDSFSPEPLIRPFDLASELRRIDEGVRTALPDSRGHVQNRSYSGRSIIGESIGKAILKAVRQMQRPDISLLLEDVRLEMLRSLYDLLRVDDPSRVDYLSPLVHMSDRQGSLTIATLNYDRSVEEVADRNGVECETGIETWLSTGQLDWPRNGLRLLKLHGSVDWVVHEARDEGQLPLKQIQKRDLDQEGIPWGGPAVVFGQSGKLRSEGPYLELLLAWHADLRRANSLLIVGYSFRDDHVNEIIARWFNADSTRRIIVLDPLDPREGYSFGPPSSFGQYFNFIDRRAADELPPFAFRFEYVSGTARDSLPQAIAAALS
jgi:SIR2-like domain